jgi:uncharacterized membrane protein (UPF0127 family)
MLVNTRTGRAVAQVVEFARTRSERRRGLLGRSGLPPGTALVLAPCNAVHTVGMQFPIDVAFIDRDGCVRHIVRGLVPTRISMCLRAKATIECAAGELGEGVLQVGDRLRLEPMGRFV